MPAPAWFPPRCTATSAARSSFTTSSSTASWPRSTARPTPPSPGPGRSPRSRTGYGPSSKTTGIAALLKTRDLSPHSLALAEAFLAPLQAAGLPARETALAFRLIYDYTIGFALNDPTTPGEQRCQCQPQARTGQRPDTQA